MKIYIVTDLEGPAGVNRWAQTREGETPEKTVAMRLLTEEVNAAIDGILDAEPSADIIVWDGHGAGGGLVFELVHSRARVILHGKGMKAPFHLDPSFDALFFVGQHAMAGTPDAPLCHTYSSRTVEYYKLNGEAIGEIGCMSAMAGAMGIPTVFLSGDDKACIEAQALIPHIVTVATKQGLGVELALHLSPETARQAIRKGADMAIRAVPRISPFTPPPPYELEIQVQEGCSIGGYLERGFERLDKRTVVMRRPDILSLFS